jgi:hypothetical protein
MIFLYLISMYFLKIFCDVRCRLQLMFDLFVWFCARNNTGSLEWSYLRGWTWLQVIRLYNNRGVRPLFPYYYLTYMVHDCQLMHHACRVVWGVSKSIRKRGKRFNLLCNKSTKVIPGYAQLTRENFILARSIVRTSTLLIKSVLLRVTFFEHLQTISIQ